MYLNIEFQKLVNTFEYDIENNINRDKLILYMTKYIDKLEYFKPYLDFKDFKNNNNFFNNILLIALNNKEKNNNNKIISISNDFTLRNIRNDEEYKRNIKSMYSECQVSGYHILGCEVAHIWEFKDCETNDDKYNKFNGLLLKSQIHKYWDANYLIINYDLVKKTLYFVINYSKIININNYELLLNNILEELKLKTHNEKCFINFNKDYFNSYVYFIKKRNYK